MAAWSARQEHLACCIKCVTKDDMGNEDRVLYAVTSIKVEKEDEHQLMQRNRKIEMEGSAR